MPVFASAADVRGKGPLQLNEERVARWCEENIARDGLVRRTHIALHRRHEIDKLEAGLPRNRCVLLRSLSRVPWRQFALE